jgi:hypothetical protein
MWNLVSYIKWSAQTESQDYCILVCDAVALASMMQQQNFNTFVQFCNSFAECRCSCTWWTVLISLHVKPNSCLCVSEISTFLTSLRLHKASSSCSKPLSWYRRKLPLYCVIPVENTTGRLICYINFRTFVSLSPFPRNPFPSHLFTCPIVTVLPFLPPSPLGFISQTGGCTSWGS